MTYIVETHDVRLDVVDEVGDFQDEVLHPNQDGRQFFIIILTYFYQCFMNLFASFNNLKQLGENNVTFSRSAYNTQSRLVNKHSSKTQHSTSILSSRSKSIYFVLSRTTLNKCHCKT